MDHEYYIEALRNIAPLKGLKIYTEKRQSVESIPDAFELLFSPLLDIISENRPKLTLGYSSKADMYVGDIQIAGSSIEEREKAHFFCTLLYFIKDLENEKWQEEYLIVNFTTGEVMNDSRYLSLIINEEIPEEENKDAVTYGYLPKDALKEAWNECKKDENVVGKFIPPQEAQELEKKEASNIETWLESPQAKLSNFSFFQSSPKQATNTLKGLIAP